MQSTIFEDDYVPQFSGHETFPLRYGWLKKAFDRVAETENSRPNRDACWDDKAISRFGVGKNMVASIRHWSRVTQIIEEPSGSHVKTTALGQLIFGADGCDPYMEDPSTLWILHWNLAGYDTKTTWFWAFNHCPVADFRRENLEANIQRLAADRGWSRVANATVKNDVACFIRTYVSNHQKMKSKEDDALECPLTELNLIKITDSQNAFRLIRGPKPTLKGGVFAYALFDFWSRHSPDTATLSFEAIAFAPGSPGRVFGLEENDLVDRLCRLDAITRGILSWTEAAGLKQVVQNSHCDPISKLIWLSQDYHV